MIKSMKVRHRSLASANLPFMVLTSPRSSLIEVAIQVNISSNLLNFQSTIFIRRSALSPLTTGDYSYDPPGVTFDVPLTSCGSFSRKMLYFFCRLLRTCISLRISLLFYPQSILENVDASSRISYTCCCCFYESCVLFILSWKDFRSDEMASVTSMLSFFFGVLRLLLLFLFAMVKERARPRMIFIS